MSLRYQIHLRILLTGVVILLLGSVMTIRQARQAVDTEISSSLNLAMQLIRLNMQPNGETSAFDVDSWLPRFVSLEQTRHLQIRLEKAHGKVLKFTGNAKKLVFSVHDEIVYVHHALSAGAKGYITKNTAPAILLEAIQKIAAGDVYIEQSLFNGQTTAKQAADYQPILARLSPREFDVFRLLAKGLTVHKIADELCLGYKTVANYSTQVKNKLNVATLAELAHIAMATGVLKT